MRHRKPVYLYCRDGLRCSLILTMLQVRAAFASIVTFHCIDELRSELKSAPADEVYCVVMVHDDNTAEDFAPLFGTLPAGTPSIEVWCNAVPLEKCRATVQLVPQTSVEGKYMGLDHAELLERLRVLCARKRGPKKVVGNALKAAA